MPAPQTAPDLTTHAYQVELQLDPRWLRFSPAVERQFQLDTGARRFKFLFACEVIGLLSLWIGIANEQRVLPETFDFVIDWWLGLTAFFAVTMSTQILLGWRRLCCHWMMDWTSAASGFLMGTAIVLATNTSPVLTATVHATNVVLVVMWFCILCRFRFRAALVATVMTVLMYAMLAKAPSEVQQLIYANNLRTLFFTAVFSLAATYLLEYRERSTYLMRKQEVVQQAALTQAGERLRQLSLQDPLTGLNNRRQFESSFDLACSQSAANGQCLGLLMVDVDYFKLFNDSYGHPAGDACLKVVADVLAQVATQEGGCAARVGGEEFVVLLPGQSLEGIQRASLAVCEGLRVANLEHKASQVASHVTASVGAVWASPALENCESTARQVMMAAVDAALYQAKLAGRNRAQIQGDAIDLYKALGADADADADACGGACVPRLSAIEASAGVGERTKDGPPTTPGGDSIAELTAMIKGQLRWLRFNPALEAEYQAARAHLRRLYLTGTGLVGIVLVDVTYVLTSDLIADVTDWLLPRQAILSVVTVLNAALIWSPIKPVLREFLYALCAAALALLALLACGRSQLHSAYVVYVEVFIIPLFACVAARQPFWATLGTALFTLVSFLLIINPDTPIEKVMAWDVTTMLLTATNFTIIASYFIERGERMDYLMARLSQRHGEAMDVAVAALHHLSSTDPLTGISNRRHFEDTYARVWNQDQGQPLSLLILDVDHFKRYNDGYGHPAGDQCLQRIALALKDVAAQDGYFVARLGGEEFGVLMPGSTAEQALLMGERICAGVRTAALAHEFSAVAKHVTVSVGVACVAVRARGNPRTLLSAADEALYRAKAAGRDRVMGPQAAPERRQVVRQFRAPTTPG